MCLLNKTLITTISHTHFWVLQYLQHVLLVFRLQSMQTPLAAHSVAYISKLEHCMDSSAMRQPSKTQPLKNGSGGITAWHSAKILQTEKKPNPSYVNQSLYKIQHFPVNGTWLCFRKECITRNKTLRMANNLGDRFRKGEVRKFEAPFFFWRG